MKIFWMLIFCSIISCLSVAADVPSAPFIVYGQVINGNVTAAESISLVFCTRQGGQIYTAKTVKSPLGYTYFKTAIDKSEIDSSVIDGKFTLTFVSADGVNKYYTKQNLQYSQKFVEWNLDISSSSGKPAFKPSLITSKSLKYSSGTYTYNTVFQPITDFYAPYYRADFFTLSGTNVAKVGSVTVKSADKDMTAGYTYASGDAIDGGFIMITPLDSKGRASYGGYVYLPIAQAQTY